MNRFWLKSPLMDPAPDPNGGGGGGGGGNPNPPNPNPNSDPPAPKLADMTAADLVRLITDTTQPLLNGMAANFDGKLKKLTPPAPPAPPNPNPPNPNPPNPNPNPNDPFASAREKELTDRLKAIEDERAEEKKQNQALQLEAEVKNALADFTWAEGQDGKGIAFEYYKGLAIRDANGNLVIGEMPLSRYIKEHVPRGFKGMLQARPVGGSGAQPHSGGAGTGKIDINDIKPGMSKEQEAAAAREIAQVLSSLRT